MSGSFYAIGFACGGGVYIAARLGLFGHKSIPLHLDTKNKRVVNGLLWNTAYWEPADCYATVYTIDVRPIRFVRVNEYRGFDYPSQIKS